MRCNRDRFLSGRRRRNKVVAGKSKINCKEKKMKLRIFTASGKTYDVILDDEDDSKHVRTKKKKITIASQRSTLPCFISPTQLKTNNTKRCNAAGKIAEGCGNHTGHRPGSPFPDRTGSTQTRAQGHPSLHRRQSLIPAGRVHPHRRACAQTSISTNARTTFQQCRWQQWRPHGRRLGRRTRSRHVFTHQTRSNPHPSLGTKYRTIP